MKKDKLILLIEKTVSDILPKRLKSYRQQAGLSLRQTAEMIGKSPSQLSFWEKGTNPPSCIDLFKLCLIYDIMLSDLFPEICNDSGPIREEIEFFRKYRNADEEVKVTIQKILEYTQERK